MWSAEKWAEGLEYMHPKPSSHSGRIVGYSETDPALGGTNARDTGISGGGVRLVARHSVADEVVGRRLRHRGHGGRFRAASAA